MALRNLPKPPFRSDDEIDRFVHENTVWWDEWEPNVVNLEPGTYTFQVAEKGPIAVFTTHFSDQEFLFKTPDGQTIMLAEYMFKPMFSRYDVAVGWEFEVVVKMVDNDDERTKKEHPQIKKYTAKVLKGE